MKVFKFGGASVNSIERIKFLADILMQYKEEQLLIVISAMGKTTNALEKVTEAFFHGKKEEALQLFDQVKKQHLNTAKYLLVTQYLACEEQMKNFFTEAEWLLYDKPVRSFDYYYDQVVSIGELLSTTIISYYLNEVNINNKWFDVRDIIRTDNNFRDANIDWTTTEMNLSSFQKSFSSTNNIFLTQGFIGATDENESTTLGREGSDYSAAVFAHMLNAESLSIWKDVEAIMNADPKLFPDALPIRELNYNELIEMAYYGALVIHPKTIKPLQNKNIPLFVKSFLDPFLPGTVIHNKPVHHLPPTIIIKENQVMLEMKTRDYSFVGEQHIGKLYEQLEKLNIKPNLTQNGAISFLCVLDDRSEKIETFALEMAEDFEVKVMRGLTLLTIRNYNNEIFEKLTKEKSILLRQQTKETIQLLMI